MQGRNDFRLRPIRRRTVTALHGLPATMHPVLRRVLAARGVHSADELDHRLQRLLPPDSLGGAGDAAVLLAEHMGPDRRILVVGDFDADGATSCALAVKALRALGAANVHYLVPNRFEYGYGLTPEIVAVAAEQAPDLLVTVDNGISSLEGVDEARRRGMRVLVTDHHLPGAQLPAADCIVNPKLPGDGFPSKHLAGVGVMFYLLLALRRHLRQRGWFEGRSVQEPNLARYLDLVALGTVADVVPLDGNNRILVAQGLERLRIGRGQAGVRALARVAGRDPSRLQAADLGFALGPRLNAAGRLTDMSLGIECLLSEDPRLALDMAAQLDSLNHERRAIEADMQAQALADLEALGLAPGAKLPAGVCIYDPDWHPGVIGILAARIRERLHRPVVAFARESTAMLKGSARSLPGLHIRDALEAVATEHPGLLARFGGHAMAAGLSLPEAHLQRFRAAFDAEVARRLGAEDLAGCLHSDGELSAADLDLDLARQLAAIAPWGAGFPEPVFDGEFQAVERRVVGSGHLRLRLQLPGRRAPLSAIAFGCTDEHWPLDSDRGHLAYSLDVNEYRGRSELQLRVHQIRPL